MKVGVPTEIRADERRVAVTPAGVRELVGRGHRVVVQSGAGAASSVPDEAYAREGAEVVPNAAAVFGSADLIVKVKEPQPPEVALLEPRHILFTYLHLAAAPELTAGLLDSGATCIAYETVENGRGRLPLLAPMSEVAGRLATQAGSWVLQDVSGGRGVLLGGVPGVSAANVVVVGGGVVGANAAEVAVGMGAKVTILDTDIDRLRELDKLFNRRCETIAASALALDELLPQADLLIGAVLVRGAKAPHILRREHLSLMRRGAVLVDVSIDQGGCFETSRPTTHSDPVYELDGVVHYCVANMPGAVPVTSTAALTNATAPYLVRLADVGVHAALVRDGGFGKGLATIDGTLTSAPVAEAQDRDYVEPEAALAARAT